VVTDLAEVFRLGTAKTEENLAFRRYLSAHHYADKPFQILASEVQRHVDCTACSNCCRLWVSLSSAAVGSPPVGPTLSGALPDLRIAEGR
jgi:hypothetical protein